MSGITKEHQNIIAVAQGACIKSRSIKKKRRTYYKFPLLYLWNGRRGQPEEESKEVITAGTFEEYPRPLYDVERISEQIPMILKRGKASISSLKPGNYASYLYEHFGRHIDIIFESRWQEEQEEDEQEEDGQEVEADPIYLRSAWPLKQYYKFHELEHPRKAPEKLYTRYEPPHIKTACPECQGELSSKRHLELKRDEIVCTQCGLTNIVDARFMPVSASMVGLGDFYKVPFGKKVVSDDLFESSPNTPEEEDDLWDEYAEVISDLYFEDLPEYEQESKQPKRAPHMKGSTKDTEILGIKRADDLEKEETKNGVAEDRSSEDQAKKSKKKKRREMMRINRLYQELKISGRLIIPEKSDLKTILKTNRRLIKELYVEEYGKALYDAKYSGRKHKNEFTRMLEKTAAWEEDLRKSITAKNKRYDEIEYGPKFKPLVDDVSDCSGFFASKLGTGTPRLQLEKGNGYDRSSLELRYKKSDS
jgi:hypothetical protein